MEVLQRVPIPRKLAARVWLLTVPSALLSFERRQHVPGIPIGRGRLLGLLLVAVGVAGVLRGRQPRNEAGQGELADEPGASPLAPFARRPAVSGGLLVLAGVGLLLRSLLLTAYALGLALAFARDTVELEDPQLPGRDDGDGWTLDETQV